ncbi:MAG: hypothetical protein WCP95_10150 [Actinomycetes bacterium]
MHPRRQPLLGIIAAASVIVISLVFISVLDWPTFRDWVSFYLMCTIPFAFVVGAFWHAEQPAAIGRLRQPVKGLAYLAVALAVGAVVAIVLLQTVGGGVTPPTPMVTQCVIISVPFSFWLTVMWGGWPFTLIRNRVLGGATLLVTVYVIAALVFETLFNYDFLKDTPVYVESVDPQGPFDAWTVLVFIVTCMAAAFLMLNFELWPLTRRPKLMAQPVLGIVWTASVVVIGGAVTYLGLHVAGMAAPTYLTTVPVPFLFGSIVVLITLEGSLYAGLKQPLRGLASAATAAVVGIALAKLYVGLSGLLSGEVPPGAPGFEGEIWLASALLAVTFPFLAFHADFFGKWPLRPQSAPVDADATR